MRLSSIILLVFPNLLFGQKSITYHQHIAPILEKNCFDCHQNEAIGPMPLTNYEEVSSYGKMIAYVTKTRLMPPFKAVEPKGEIKGEKRLTEQEIQQIDTWVKQGLPKGKDQVDEQAATISPKTLQNPDAVFSMSEGFEQYGIYYDQYRVFSIPTNFPEDKYVSAIEFVPGNKKIVRQAMISIDTSDRVLAWEEWDPQYGYFSFGELGFVPLENRWYSWNPSQPFTEFRENEAKFLPKNAKLLLHIHYGPTGVRTADSSSICLKFATKKPEKIIQTAPLIHLYNLTNDTFYIPENEKTRFHGKFTVPYDIELLGLMPHAHYLGRKWEVFAVEPESRKATTLLKIEDWDFHWKQHFDYKNPKILKKRTVIHALSEYDNTAENLANPSEPPRAMSWGKQMYEELFLVYFSYVPTVEKEEKKPFFEILPTAVNVSRPIFNLSFETEKTGKFSLALKNFEEEKTLQIFNNQYFKEGQHVVEVDFKNLKKGNYYFELVSGEFKTQRLFVYVDSNLFD